MKVGRKTLGSQDEVTRPYSPHMRCVRHWLLERLIRGVHSLLDPDRPPRVPGGFWLPAGHFLLPHLMCE